jgi:hypothetical protein
MNYNSLLIKVAFQVLLFTSGLTAETENYNTTTYTFEEELSQREVDYTVFDMYDASATPEIIDLATISAFELRRQAAQRLPIPEYVMDDTVRKYKPTLEDHYITLKDGSYENLILLGENSLREPE